MRNVPLGAWIFASVAVLGLLAAFTVSAVTGSDTAELRWLVLAILNGAGGLASIGGAVYAGAAARNSKDAADHLNGDLDPRVQRAVTRALAAQRVEDTRPGGEYRR